MVPQRTRHLRLEPLGPDHVDEVHDVFADPRTWTHLPSGRFTERSQTEAMVEAAQDSCRTRGLGPWALRLTSPVGDVGAGRVIGTAGVTGILDCCWNLGYRITPETWGHGLATEVVQAAVRAAHEIAPTHAITARVLSTNPASVSVLERAGFACQWTGRSPYAVPGPGGVITLATRLIYADRVITAHLLRQLVTLP